MRRCLLSLVVLITACDGEPAPADAGPRADAAAAGVPMLTCVLPDRGASLLAEPGDPIRIVVAVDQRVSGQEVRIGDTLVPVDDVGLAETTVPARFGVNNVLVTASAGGVTRRDVCSFLAAPGYVPEGAALGDAVTMRFTPSAIDDGDGASTLGSLDDTVERALAIGLLSRYALRYLVLDVPPTAASCEIPPCEEPLFEVNGFRYDPDPSTLVDPTSSALEPVEGGVRFTGRGAAIDLDVTHMSLFSRSEGSYGAAGRVALSDIEVIASLAVSIGADGSPHAEIAEVLSVRAGTVDTSGLVWTASGGAPDPFSAATEAWIEAWFERADGLDEVGRDVSESVTTMLDELVASLVVDAVPETLELAAIDGSTLRVAATTRPTRATGDETGLVFAFDTTFEPMGPSARSRGVPVHLERLAASDVAEGLGTAVSIDAVNQVLHAVWAQGGLSGIVAPSMIVAPDMIVAPTMIVAPDMIVAPTMVEMASALPPVATTTDEGVALSFGGVEMTLAGDGPFSGGVRVTWGGRAEARFDMAAGDRLSTRAVAITELEHTSEPALDGDADAALGAWLVVFAHHATTLLLDRSQPPLPLASAAVPTDIEVEGLRIPTGTVAGTRLGTGSPSLRIRPDRLEAVGALTERASP